MKRSATEATIKKIQAATEINDHNDAYKILCDLLVDCLDKLGKNSGGVKMIAHELGIIASRHERRGYITQPDARKRYVWLQDLKAILFANVENAESVWQSI